MASYDKLIEIFGDIPTVNFGPEVVGSTGYIDKIKVEDMGNNVIVTFTDQYNRKAIAFKVTIREYYENNNEMRQYVIVFHQRYTDNDNNYVRAESHYYPSGYTDNLLGMCAVKIMNGNWCYPADKDKVESLVNGTHPKLLII